MFRNIHLSGKTAYIPRWGNFFERKDSHGLEKALWIKLLKPPVLNIWQPPSTLGELREICTLQDLDIMSALKSFAPHARDREQHMVLIGFPAPKYVGEAPNEIIWQAFMLPVLSYGHLTTRNFQSGKQKNWKATMSVKGAARGFRPGEEGWWMSDKMTILRDTMPLEWIRSKNCHPRTISSRGQLLDTIKCKNVLVIGVGCMGSAISEMLVRAGVVRLTCLDDDVVDLGNLCRHTLSVDDISEVKSLAVANRLCTLNPNANVSCLTEPLVYNEGGAPNINLDAYDIIIDTTGEDGVLEILQTGEFIHNKVFCSVSIGLGAKRMYMALLKAKHPDFSNFIKSSEKYIIKDWAEYELGDLPRESIGCWHPLFPARNDDIWLAAGTAIKSLEGFVIDDMQTKLIVIYEQCKKNGIYAGFQPIEVINDGTVF